MNSEELNITFFNSNRIYDPRQDSLHRNFSFCFRNFPISLNQRHERNKGSFENHKTNNRNPTVSLILIFKFMKLYKKKQLV